MNVLMSNQKFLTAIFKIFPQRKIWLHGFCYIADSILYLLYIKFYWATKHVICFHPAAIRSFLGGPFNWINVKSHSWWRHEKSSPRKVYPAENSFLRVAPGADSVLEPCTVNFTSYKKKTNIKVWKKTQAQKTR